MPDQSIKVSFCVAYDWALLAYSLPLVYEAADTICVSVDKDRISWSGNPFSWDDVGFQQLLCAIDKAGKIRLLEEDFHLPDLTPIQNEVRQRQRMAEFMGSGGWHIQLDSDEFFLDFDGFVAYLKRLRPKRKINVVCPLITLYKKLSNGFLYVNPVKFSEIQFIQVATQYPRYLYGRRNDYFDIHSSYAILHLSWARPESEISEKIKNWGHSNDFNAAMYLEFWKGLNKSNYTEYKNIHYLNPNIWPRLSFLAAESTNSLIDSYRYSFKLPLNRRILYFRNSIWISRLNSIIRKLKRI